jgi:hypothetical protein
MKEDWTEISDRFDRLSETPDSKSSTRTPAPTESRLIRSMLKRAKFVEDNFATSASFERFLSTTRNPEKARRRIRESVARILAPDDGEAASPEIAAHLEAEYVGMVNKGLIDPAADFDVVPPLPTLCSFKKIAETIKKYDDSMTPVERQEFGRQWQVAYRLFETRWQRIVDRPFDGDVPWVADLTDKKSPIPLRPGWALNQVSREALSMGAEPEQQIDEAPAADLKAANDEAEGEGTCSADDLLARAGIPPLRPPSQSDPRYTFPGHLLQREDIYYDYGLIVPVDECGPMAAEIRGLKPRALDAVRAIAGQLIALLEFVNQLGLSASLGSIPASPFDAGGLVVDRIKADINTLIGQVDDQTPLDVIQSWKATLAQWENTIRDAARRSLFQLDLGGQDPRDFLLALSTAIANVPNVRRYQDDKIAYDPVPEGTTNATYLEVNHFQPGPVRDAHGNMCIDNNQQVRTLGPYLEYIAGEFYDRLQALVAAANAMKVAVESFQGNTELISTNVQKLSSGSLNEVAFVIAGLLSDLESQLPLWTDEWAEGSKRLGLLMIYRQYWTPEGYVKGKLVGYKNLLPDQKETVTRKTFIRTLTERQTLQEFAQTRQQDYTQTLREASEISQETTNKFNASISASGSFSFLIGSVSATTNTGYDFSSISKSTHSSLAEAITKATMSFNERREVKIRSEVETKDELESVVELRNPNQEITANYFFYQLLRQYAVRVELHDVRPVLLRTRYVPPEGAIGDKFLMDYAHVLLPVLPAQLSADLAENINHVDSLGRQLTITRSRFNEEQLAYQTVLGITPPSDPELARAHSERVVRLQETARTAFNSYVSVSDAYRNARTKLDRVTNHVRQNRVHYMQFIWQSSPNTDFDRILARESFGGMDLPLLTRGLMKQGYFGNEVIFDYAGPSWAIADVLSRMIVPGSDFATLSDEQIRQTELFRQLARQYSDEDLDDLIAQIREHAYIVDPAGTDAVLSSRRIQVAQDALVIETMPGSIPLLEGFKAAHRMLDLERACIENEHLRARVADRPWREHGEDSYRVYRREGVPAPSVERSDVDG